MHYKFFIRLLTEEAGGGCVPRGLAGKLGAAGVLVALALC